MDRYDWLLRLQIENRPTRMRGACGGAPRSLCPAGSLRGFHAAFQWLNECCHLNLNLQVLNSVSTFTLFMIQCFHDSARKCLGKIFRLSYHAQIVYSRSENVHHLHILGRFYVVIGSFMNETSSMSFDFYIRNTRPIRHSS